LSFLASCLFFCLLLFLFIFWEVLTKISNFLTKEPRTRTEWSG
jgi:hypothetical protein